MSKVVSLHQAPDQAERLIDIASQGGIEVSVHFCRIAGTSLLFSLIADVAPSTGAMAAMVEMTARFKANAAFRECVEGYCVSLGAAVHAVHEQAWKFRDLTTAEMAALKADEPQMNS